ncbi:U6 small nuclear RNA (adenine-(43)-N(6))-methyltransferase [Odontomachus brunneus]|uniref:U6 small nuclear RNA (adenine-(43)-N(6))-methyltransferase n=1 Tax=Odontomachus brunneus TaxID=486640 RepID=UPI0013F1D1D7|nr:U6 small nuclear RNA (adenine-(43)-N(6))-methyltransferase [Odontomachus brunneus]
MHVKKYIHPRNKYKKSPDYKKLAIMYPEFREVAITDLTGKVKIDFKKKESVRVLTETLLKHDFDLHVSIPPDKLNPALTLRMNYVLWIEDLMKHSKLTMDKTTGIDIGTGAISIYALLLAKIYKCHMIGTEVDKESINHAENCIRKNNLQDLIKVVTVNSDSIFKNAVEKDKVYDFSMCNPPFFENEGDGERVAKALPPRNAPTGNEGELKTKGGELAFVTRMIEESIELGDRIKVYSTMIGKKVDFFCLKKVIRSNNIKNVTWTVFCQGHTTRWGLAWSFLPKNVLDLNTAPVIRKAEKSVMPLFENKTSITFPMNDKFSCMDDVISFLNSTAKELNIELQEVPISEDNFDGWVCQLTAKEKTWEHARRKRRLTQQLALKKLKESDGECVKTSVNTKETSDTIITAEENINIKQANEKLSEETLSARKEKYGESSSECVPLLTCELWVEIESSEIEETVPEDDLFRIWMIFENGSGGLEALQSLRQYLMNRLGVKRTSLHDPSKSVKKRRKKMKRNTGEDVTVPLNQS